jgi:hypothetical protein
MPADSVPGDAILTGGDITFEGITGGDYLGAGGKQRIGGHVHGSTRAAGGDIVVAGVTDRNATIAAGNVTLDSTATVGGNAYVTGGNVTVRGSVRGSLLASGGQVTIDGPVGRDVEVRAGALHLGPRAQISGNLRYKVPKDKVTIDRAAHVAGTTTALPVERRIGTGSLIWMLGVVILGIVFVAVFPTFTTGAAEILYRSPGRAALTGIVWICLIPFAAAIAAVTGIGLPLAVVGVAVWFALLFLGGVPIELWIGKRLLRERARPGRSGAIICVLVGGLILAVVGLIPVIGNLVLIISGILGIGAILLRTKGPAAQPEYSI